MSKTIRNWKRNQVKTSGIQEHMEQTSKIKLVRRVRIDMQRLPDDKKIARDVGLGGRLN